MRKSRMLETSVRVRGTNEYLRSLIRFNKRRAVSDTLLNSEAILTTLNCQYTIDRRIWITTAQAIAITWPGVR